MNTSTHAFVQLAFAAIDMHDTLCRLGLEGPAMRRFSHAVKEFIREIEQPGERERVLLALDRAGAPREPGMKYACRRPFNSEVEPLGHHVYRVRLDQHSYLCLFDGESWAVKRLQST